MYSSESSSWPAYVSEVCPTAVSGVGCKPRRTGGRNPCCAPQRQANLSHLFLQILLCDSCDSGYHTACLRPPLMIIPDGEWFCPPCQHVSFPFKKNLFFPSSLLFIFCRWLKNSDSQGNLFIFILSMWSAQSLE